MPASGKTTLFISYPSIVLTIPGPPAPPAEKTPFSRLDNYPKHPDNSKRFVHKHKSNLLSRGTMSLPEPDQTAGSEEHTREDYAALLARLKETQHRLRFLEMLIDELPSPIFAKDENARFCLLNKAYENFFHVRREDLLNLTTLDLDYLKKETRGKYHQEDIEAIRNNSEIHYETTYQTKDGNRSALYWRKGIVIPDSDEKGVIGIIVDISSRKLLENELNNNIKKLEATRQELQRISQTDELTQLPNRRFFNTRLQENISFGNRHEEPFCLLMADLDHFKRINDRFGHDEGDITLRKFASALRKNCRREDIAARFGGEEFMILMPLAKFDEAWSLAERIRQTTKKHILPDGNSLTVSIGVTEFRLGDTPDDIIKRVDDALYKAKANGRDQVAG